MLKLTVLWLIDTSMILGVNIKEECFREKFNLVYVQTISFQMMCRILRG